MSNTTPHDLARVVRSGKLDDVLVVLNSGLGSHQPAELGLGLAMACFLGHREIARELIRRGAPLNLPPGLADASPIMMAIKGGQTKTVRLLISYGAQVPAGVDTGLTHEEYAEALAKARARHRASPSEKKQKSSTRNAESHAHKHKAPAPPTVNTPPRAPATLPAPPLTQLASVRPLPVRTPVVPPKAETPIPANVPIPPLAPAPPAPKAPQPPRQRLGKIVEEIELTACYGIDTNVLEADFLRPESYDSQDNVTPKDEPDRK